MVLKEQRFHSIMDIYAFRVIVHDADICYRVLGQMHSLYKPRPGRFKDYIAIPKANGYQSLHTSMIGPHGVPVEVQIGTEDMDQMAEMGVAAHWAYKEHGGESSTTAQIRAQRWMQSLLELQQSAGSSFEFIESVKSNLFPDEIYVFTRKGALSNCLLAPRRWTSPTRCIPISVMPASARASTVSPIRCRSHSPAVRLSKLSPRRALARTPPG